MRRLCLGGTFNPIHVGHLACARAAAEAGGFSSVCLVPTAANPHKRSTPATAGMAAAADRLAMCQQAVAGDPFFVVDDREVRRPGPTYTFDTAVELSLFPEHLPRVAWLIGTDLLGRLHTWHRFDELLNVVDFVVMRRAGEPIGRPSLDSRVAALADLAVDVPQIEISSTRLRERVRLGLPIRHLVPPSVERYIANSGLYRG